MSGIEAVDFHWTLGQTWERKSTGQFEVLAAKKLFGSPTVAAVGFPDDRVERFGGRATEPVSFAILNNFQSIASREIDSGCFGLLPFGRPRSPTEEDRNDHAGPKDCQERHEKLLAFPLVHAFRAETFTAASLRIANENSGGFTVDSRP